MSTYTIKKGENSDLLLLNEQGEVVSEFEIL